jgi:CBS-domain-containing membrane protein
VYFDDLLDAPVAEIKNIYNYFGMPWSDELESILNHFMSDNTREKHGKHAYTAEMFGLDEKDLDKAFQAYRERFNISKNNR